MLLAILALSCAAVAAEDDKVVQLPHSWSVGTKYHIEFTKTREDIEDGLPKKTASSRTPIDVEVIAKREDGYTFRWTFGKPIAGAEVKVGQALIDKVTALVDGLRMDLLIDSAGSVTGLANAAEMDAHIEKMSQRLFAELGSLGALEDSQLALLKKAVAEMKGPAFQASYVSYPQMFYMPAGAALTVGEKNMYEDRLPNPFGGEPLPSKAYLQLRELRTAANEAVVEWRQSIDSDRAGPILDASIRAYAKRIGQELPEGAAAMSFDAIEDASTFVYDLATGIPKSVVSSRTTTIAGRRRIDSQEFSVSWPDAAKK
ncbi:MAG: hypothetical protein JNL28_07635 [Planctomycetes bacterium]|nr:hypothetical protein [Planctomycetota bacterium]